jgi:hypothetical protein
MWHRSAYGLADESATRFKVSMEYWRPTNERSRETLRTSILYMLKSIRKEKTVFCSSLETVSAPP